MNMSTLIALDAGHGLNTPGKRTPDGIHEWELNDKVRDKVVRNLQEYDVEFVFPDNNEGSVDEGLVSRRTMYVKKKVAAAVSIHHNANTGTWNSATGVEVYVDKNATARDNALAKSIYERLVTNTGMRGRGIKAADWTVIDQDSVPAVLVEGGFMDGKNDYKVITSDAGQEAYARAVSDGLIEFLGLTKKSGGSTSTPVTSGGKSVDEIAKEVIAGKWCNGNNRKTAITNAGYDYTAVQAKVNEILNGKTTAKPATKPAPAPAKKSVDEIAKEVIAGKWGTGDARKKALGAAGYNYSEVQARVNAMLGVKSTSTSTPAKKSINEIAREVIQGKWGNGDARRKALTAAGYDFNAVQKRVNEML